MKKPYCDVRVLGNWTSFISADILCPTLGDAQGLLVCTNVFQELLQLDKKRTKA